MLTRLKGIGPEIATMLQLEAFFRSFGNRREVAAYAGLAPMPWKSGRLDREQGISKAGNPRLRTTMVELAWLWLRHQPGSALSSWFRERVGRAKGRVRRIAVVALARRLSRRALAVCRGRRHARGSRDQGIRTYRLVRSLHNCQQVTGQ